VRALMIDARVGHFCLDLNTATSEETLRIMGTATQQLDACARNLSTYAEGARRALERQDDLIPTLIHAR
jgi:hypothetical protein